MHWDHEASFDHCWMILTLHAELVCQHGDVDQSEMACPVHPTFRNSLTHALPMPEKVPVPLTTALLFAPAAATTIPRPETFEWRAGLLLTAKLLEKMPEAACIVIWSSTGEESVREDLRTAVNYLDPD